MQIGHVTTCDISGVSSWGLLTDPDAVERALLEAADAADFTVVETLTTQFVGDGLTAIVVVAESHLAVQTWPEHRYVALSVESCKDRASTDRLVASFLDGMEYETVRRRTVDRYVA